MYCRVRRPMRGLESSVGITNLCRRVRRPLRGLERAERMYIHFASVRRPMRGLENRILGTVIESFCSPPYARIRNSSN